MIISAAIIAALNNLESEIEKLEDELSCANSELDDLNVRFSLLQDTLEEAQTAAAAPPLWGSCRAGHDGGYYLDSQGWCSPDCALGQPRVG